MRCQFCNLVLRHSGDGWTYNDTFKYFKCLTCNSEFSYDKFWNMIRCSLNQNTKEICIEYNNDATYFRDNYRIIFSLDFIAKHITPTNFEDKFNLYILMS